MESLTRRIVTGAALLGMLSMVVGLSAAVGGASAASTNWSSGGHNSTTSNTWNVTLNHPAWNQGNLCNVSKTGSQEWCTFTGPSNTSTSRSMCGCTNQLSYNFSADKKTIYVSVSGLTRTVNQVYINLKGNHDTVVLNVTGSMCQGGTLEFASLGEHNTLDLNLNASGFKGVFSFYLDHAVYNANITGNSNDLLTTFAGVGEAKNLCPFTNMSASSTANVVAWGKFNAQYLVWANAESYSTSLHYTTLPGTGSYDYLGWENTTSLVCGWVHAPTCSNSGHHYGIAELSAKQD